MVWDDAREVDGDQTPWGLVDLLGNFAFTLRATWSLHRV